MLPLKTVFIAFVLASCFSNAMAMDATEVKSQGATIPESTCKPYYELGKSWVYKSWSPYLSDEDAVYIKITVVRDTVVDNRHAFILMNENMYVKEKPTYSIGAEENGSVCAYSEEQKKFYPVFDFGLDTGSVIDISFFDGFEEIKAGAAQVTNIRNINIEKNERKVLTLQSYPDKGAKHYWMEGIGSFDDFPMRLTEKPVGYIETLMECYLGDECLYKKDNSPEYGIAEFVPTVQNGKIWEYATDDMAYHYYTIGESREVNDNTYFEFFQYKSFAVNDKQVSEVWQGKRDVSWIRERNGKIYLLTENNRPVREIEAGRDDYSEFLLYDFNKDIGDEWLYPSDIDLLGETYPYFVETGYTKLEYGTTAKTLSLQRMKPYYDTPLMMIEGVGIAENGHLANFRIETSENPEPYSDIPGSTAKLNRVFQPSGEVLYSRKDVSVPPVSGIDTINSEYNPKSNVIFDLMGNQVPHPLPGTIYIRGGQKFIIRAE